MKVTQIDSENKDQCSKCPPDHLCVLDKQLDYKCICVSINCMLSTYRPNPELKILQKQLHAIASPTTSTTTSTTTTTTTSTTTTTMTDKTKVLLSVPLIPEPINPCDSNPCLSGHICISNRAATEYQCICISSGCLESTTKRANMACLDTDPAACRFAKSQQLCSNNNFINAVEVTVYCKKSCNTCVNS